MKERRLPLGVDLGEARVRVAEMMLRRDGRVRLLGVAGSDVGTDGSDALRVAIKELGSREQRCFLMIRSNEAGLRAIRLPQMTGPERERAVALEATALLGGEPTAVLPRYVALRDRTTIVAATFKASVKKARMLAATAGLKTAGIDHEGLALARMGQLPLLDIGLQRSTLICTVGPIPHVRTIPIGGGAFTAALARDYGIAPELAEHRKRTIGLAGAGSEELARYVRAVEEELLDLRASEGLETRLLYVAGNGARLLSLREEMQQGLGIAVEPARLDTVLDTELPPDAERAGALDWFGAVAAALRTQRSAA